MSSCRMKRRRKRAADWQALLARPRVEAQGPSRVSGAAKRHREDNKPEDDQPRTCRLPV